MTDIYAMSLTVPPTSSNRDITRPRHAQTPTLRFTGEDIPGADDVLTDDAVAFVAELARAFTPRVKELLSRRRAQQARHDAGERPHFLEETREIREKDWTVAPLPKDLLDRRVE